MQHDASRIKPEPMTTALKPKRDIAIDVGSKTTTNAIFATLTAHLMKSSLPALKRKFHFFLNGSVYSGCALHDRQRRKCKEHPESSRGSAHNSTVIAFSKIFSIATARRLVNECAVKQRCAEFRRRHVLRYQTAILRAEISITYYYLFST